jgi:hypothetical protein
MKQSVTLYLRVTLIIFSLAFLFASCSKKDSDISPPPASSSFTGQFQVVDGADTYIIQVENKGNNKYQIKNFGGFLNTPVNAVLEGNTLTIPTQTFYNPNGHTLTLVGIGALVTKNSKDDTVKFDYTVTGFANYSGDFEGTRK